MVSVQRARTLRWTAVTTTLAALIAIPALLSVNPVAATSLLGAQIVAAARASGSVAHQGLVEVDGRLGLPELPFDTGATDLLDATTSLRTWWLSESSWRTDTLTTGGQEQEYIANTDTVQWSFDDNEARLQPIMPGWRLPRTTDLLPPVIARQLLEWLGPTDKISDLPASRVAGFDAAGVEITPADNRTSVSRVDIWIDPASGLPLSVAIFARGAQTPTLRSQFVDVDMTAPDPHDLSPTLSSAVNVTHEDHPDIISFLTRSATQTFPLSLASLPTTSAVDKPIGLASYGLGFARVAILRLPNRAILRLPERAIPRILDTLSTTSVSARVIGGRIAQLPGSLLQVAVLVTDAGPAYLLVGNLTGESMRSVAIAAVALGAPA